MVRFWRYRPVAGDLRTALLADRYIPLGTGPYRSVRQTLLSGTGDMYWREEVGERGRTSDGVPCNNEVAARLSETSTVEEPRDGATDEENLVRWRLRCDLLLVAFLSEVTRKRGSIDDFSSPVRGEALATSHLRGEKKTRRLLPTWGEENKAMSPFSLRYIYIYIGLYALAYRSVPPYRTISSKPRDAGMALTFYLNDAYGRQWFCEAKQQVVLYPAGESVLGWRERGEPR
ncbi:hypothetical protein BHE74_00038627 [Ensete ventricosum]|nr:hypothetical protein BHE74_00038627 [Ensete ventricosum]